MSDIRIHEGTLIVVLDSNHESNSVIHRFLKRLGFNEKGNEWVRKKIDEKTIVRIKKFIENLNGELVLDEQISSLLQDRTQRIQNFQAQLTEALRIKNTSDESFENINIPEFLPENKLKKYQIKPVIHGHHLGSSANFSVPGAGKTWMAYATYFLSKNDPEPDNVNKLLVICPQSAFIAWENEFKDITGKEIDNIKRITGTQNQREIIYSEFQNYEIFLVNYSKVINDSDRESIIQMLKNEKFFVILDESHQAKNYTSQRSEGIREITNFAKKRMILTGTPMPKDYKDLWNQFNFLFPNENLLGSYENYLTRVDNPDSQNEIREILNPLWTRITKSQLNLPEITPVTIPVPMSEIQTRIYETIALEILENEQRRSWIHALNDVRSRNMTYLIEAATDPSLLRSNNQFSDELLSIEGVPIEELIEEYGKYEHPGKLDALRQLMVPIIQNKEKVIIWCNFTGTIEKIQDMFDVETRVINGQIAKTEEENRDDNREKYLREFRTDPECNILIANPASLSESVSLHKECHRAIYVDRTYNAAHWIQSKNRIHRIGMEDVDTFYTILCSTYTDNRITIDSVINDRLREKERRLEQFLNDPQLNVNDIDLDWNSIDQPTELNQDYDNLIQHLREKFNDTST